MNATSGPMPPPNDDLATYFRRRLEAAIAERDNRRTARAAARDSLTVAHTRRMLDSSESEVSRLRQRLAEIEAGR